jgi:hypothetical protein
MFLAKADKKAIGVSAFMLITIGIYMTIEYVRVN